MPMWARRGQYSVDCVEKKKTDAENRCIIHSDAMNHKLIVGKSGEGKKSYTRILVRGRWCCKYEIVWLECGQETIADCTSSFAALWGGKKTGAIKLWLALKKESWYCSKPQTNNVSKVSVKSSNQARCGEITPKRKINETGFVKESPRYTPNWGKC